MTRASVLLAAALVVIALPAHAAEERRALEAGARASVLAGELDVQPAFDPAIADSRSSSSSGGATSLDSVVWPSFLVDAFFFLYGFQSVERPLLGIAEARWPQGPLQADATLSDLAFANGGDPESVPGKGGRSRATAGAFRASGVSSIADATLAGMTIEAARSSTSASTDDGEARAEASQSVAGVSVGPLRIETITGSARATTAEASARLVVAGATVGGAPVQIDHEGVRAATDEHQDRVNDALRAAGITARLVPGSEERSAEGASASSGGVLVGLTTEATDPTGTPRNVRVGFLLGSAAASARAATIASRPANDVDEEVTDAPEFIRTTITIPPSVSDVLAAPTASGPLVRRRTIVTPVAGFAASARGAYAAVMLVALGLLLVRPLLRAASRS